MENDSNASLHLHRCQEFHHNHDLGRGFLGMRKTGLFIGTDTRDRTRDLLAGMTSGFFCKIFEYPFDTVKVLQQTSVKYGSMNAPQVCGTIIKEGGPKAMYQGLASPLLGAMVENATVFVAYGAMKQILDVESKPTVSNPVPMWKYLVSGAGSGICSAFVLTPVELVKCRLQIQQGSGIKLYKGPIDVVAKSIRETGISGLWKGNVSCLIREIPGNMAWFGTYELVRNRFARVLGYEAADQMPLWCAAVSGACAGVAYWTIPFPADSIKSRIQTNPAYAHLTTWQSCRKAIAEDGILALYRGLGVTCARAAPSHALIFFFYELASEFLQNI